MEETRVIRIVIDSSKATDGGKAAQRALEQIEQSTGTLSRAMTGLESTFRSLFAGYLGVQGVRMLVETADAFTKFTNSLKVAGVAGTELGVVQDRLFAAANKHGVEIGAVGQLYSRLSMSSKELGASQTEMLKFVDGVTAALRVQGGSTEQASGALLQLAQAMGAGVVRAEEFNSVLEGALPIAQAAARGIAGMEGSVAKLRAAITEGKVTSQQFFEGTLKGFKETEEQADRSSLTISAGVTTVTNAWTRFIGELDKTTGSSATAVAALGNLAKALSEVADQLARGRASGEGFWATVLQDSKSAAAKERAAKGQSVPLWLRPQAEQDAYRLQQLEQERNTPQAQGRESMIDEEIRRLNAASQLAAQAIRNAEDMQRLLEGGLPARNAPPAVPGKATGGGGGTASVKKDVDEIGELIKKIEQDAQRLKDSFIEGTEALTAQNEILAVELKLIGDAPEIRARELAVLKATNEAKKAGVDLESQAFRDRLAAVEAGEQLRIQQDEIKKSQELWTEPLKQALRDIQSIGADAFDKLLENGKFSFEELGQTFMRIIRRMAAEFLALATIRPVMSVLVNAVSPSMAQSMGLGSTGFGALGGGGGGGMSGGGLGGLFGGGFSSALGDFGSWLNTPFTGPYAGISPAGMQGVPMLSGSAGAGLTPLGLIGGLGSIGMGAYGLASGNPIGGAAGILGGGMSLLSSAGLIGSAFGPIGMGIGLIGGLLGGLLGGQTPPTITNQTYGQLSYGSGGWYTTGGAWGPSANASGTQQGLAGLGGGISSVLGLLGGVKDPSKVWGLSAMNKTVSGKDWSSSSDSTYLVDPSGNQTLWRMNEANMMDTGASQVARASILGGAVGEISANMRQVVQSIGETTSATLQELATAITAVKGFDDAIAGLNKTTTSAEQAIAQIDQQFASLYATANQYGLSVSDLDAAKAKARLGYATDFGKGLDREILAMTDPKAAALQDVEDWRKMMADNNKWLLDNVAGAMDQIVKIEELAGLKRAAIIEQTTASALNSLKSSLDRLLYGDLSGAAPGDVLSGTKATYMADLAKAFTGDAAAAGRLNSSTADYMQAAAGFYGTSSTAYQALRRQTIIDVASAYRYNGGQFGDIPAAYDVIMGNSLSGLPAASTATALATVSQQMIEVTSALTNSAQSDAELAQLFRDSIALWQRIAAKIGA